MHITSDYFRGHDTHSSEDMGIAERWARSVKNAARVYSEQQQGAEEDAANEDPLKPSNRTLKMMAHRYKGQHGLRHSA